MRPRQRHHPTTITERKTVAQPVDKRGPVDDELEPLSSVAHAAHLDIDTDGLTDEEVKEAIEIREAELGLSDEAEQWLAIVADVEGL